MALGSQGTMLIPKNTILMVGKQQPQPKGESLQQRNINQEILRIPLLSVKHKTGNA